MSRATSRSRAAGAAAQGPGGAIRGPGRPAGRCLVAAIPRSFIGLPPPRDAGALPAGGEDDVLSEPSFADAARRRMPNRPPDGHTGLNRAA
jgi:hypothetical protein